MHPYTLFPCVCQSHSGLQWIRKNGCGFWLSVQFCAVNSDHYGASLVPTIRNPEGPLVSGCFNTTPMYFSIQAKVSVLYREVGCSWEGQLREAPLYSLSGIDPENFVWWDSTMCKAYQKNFDRKPHTLNCTIPTPQYTIHKFNYGGPGVSFALAILPLLVESTTLASGQFDPR